MSDIALHELEAAINYWRSRSPAEGDELRLCPQAGALSRPYALMIIQHQTRIALDALDAAAREAWETYRQANAGAAPLS